MELGCYIFCGYAVVVICTDTKNRMHGEFQNRRFENRLSRTFFFFFCTNLQTSHHSTDTILLVTLYNINGSFFSHDHRLVHLYSLVSCDAQTSSYHQPVFLTIFVPRLIFPGGGYGSEYVWD